LNATLGPLSLSSLAYANRSIISDDTTYANYLSNIATITSNRDALASEIKTLLDAATFYDQPINDSTASSLITATQALSAQVQSLGRPLAATHDFNGDGKSDILWYNTTSGQAVTWLINGTTVTGGGSPGSAGSPWALVGQRDFNGDGLADLLWRNGTTGQTTVWFLN